MENEHPSNLRRKRDTIPTQRFLACSVAAALLTACTGGAQQTGLAITQAGANAAQVTLSPADIAQLQQACAQASPALAVATSPGVPQQVSRTAIYPQALCDDLARGIVPPTADGNSPKWLATTLAATQDAAAVANVVLPVALKALPIVAAML